MASARVSAKRGAYKSNRRLEWGQMQGFERDGVSGLQLGGSAAAGGASKLWVGVMPPAPKIIFTFFHVTNVTPCYIELSNKA